MLNKNDITKYNTYTRNLWPLCCLTWVPSIWLVQFTTATLLQAEYATAMHNIDLGHLWWSGHPLSLHIAIWLLSYSWQGRGWGGNSQPAAVRCSDGTILHMWSTRRWLGKLCKIVKSTLSFTELFKCIIYHKAKKVLASMKLLGKIWFT